MAEQFLRITGGDAAGAEIGLEDGLLIGRTASGDGSLGGDFELSREHARIERTVTGELLIEDLGSTNGTYVNGERIAAATPIRPGDTISVGSSTLEVAGTLPPQAQATAMAATPPTPPTEQHTRVGGTAGPPGGPPTEAPGGPPPGVGGPPPGVGGPPPGVGGPPPGGPPPGVGGPPPGGPPPGMGGPPPGVGGPPPGVGGPPPGAGGPPPGAGGPPPGVGGPPPGGPPPGMGGPPPGVGGPPPGVGGPPAGVAGQGRGLGAMPPHIAARMRKMAILVVLAGFLLGFGVATLVWEVL